jgi:hypothetical protein
MVTATAPMVASAAVEAGGEGLRREACVTRFPAHANSMETFASASISSIGGVEDLIGCSNGIRIPARPRLHYSQRFGDNDVMRSTLYLVLYGMLAVVSSPLPASAQTNSYSPVMTTRQMAQSPINRYLDNPGLQVAPPPFPTGNTMGDNTGMAFSPPDSTKPASAITPFTAPGWSFGGNAPGVGAGGLSVVPGGVH